MMIYDHVSKKQEKVDNLPIGFALPVGILETFGDLLTLGFEQAFTMVSNTNYRDYGMVFGARIWYNYTVSQPNKMNGQQKTTQQPMMQQQILQQPMMQQQIIQHQII
ncbi:MAG: conjugal transfer protein TraG N-terminal domain-containing protein [Candidatus Tisiphia sp.]